MTPNVLHHAHCLLGENPLWDDQRRRLYWTDIDGGRIHAWDAVAHEARVIYAGTTVGGFTLQQNGDLLLFRVDDIALLDSQGLVSVRKGVSDDGMQRFNDVIADPAGRVFAGTIGRTSESGGLHRLDPDGTMTLLFRGTGCSNGMGFSPDLRTFYWTCSTTRRIFAFDYDRETGALADRRLCYTAGEDEGVPDGLAVDAGGDIWSARWDGFAVIRHRPDGTVAGRIEVPAAKASAVCFWGENLDRLAITSAGGSPDGQGLEGALFDVAVGVRGQVEHRSRLRTD